MRATVVALLLVGCTGPAAGRGDQDLGSTTGSMPADASTGPAGAASSTGSSSTAASTTADSTGDSGSDTGGEAAPWLVVDPSTPAWFAYADGRPHFLCGPGDPEDFLFRGTELADGTRVGDQETIIAKLAPTGANGIYLQAVRSFGGDGDATHDPFIGHDPTAGVNEAVLAQWHGWLMALSDAGVVTYLIVYDDGAAPFGGGDEVGPAERVFLEALVGALADVPRLVWVVAEEYGEALGMARVENIAGVIRASDPHAHPIGVHQLDGLQFDFAESEIIDQFTIQYNVDDAALLHAGMVQAFAAAAGRYNLDMSEAAMHGVGAVARHKNWAVAMGGAYVMVLGMDVVSTADSDLEDCGRLVQFFESTRFRETQPADELAVGATQYVLAAPGQAYLLYSAAADGPMGAQLVAGTYELRWFDPVDGDAVVVGDVVVGDGPTQWPVPEGIGPEVAVAVERVP